MDSATQITIVTIICSTILGVMTLWVNRNVNTLRPEVKSVREQLTEANILLAEANKFIFSQDAKMGILRDENAGLAATQYPVSNQTRRFPPGQK